MQDKLRDVQMKCSMPYTETRTSLNIEVQTIRSAASHRTRYPCSSSSSYEICMQLLTHTYHHSSKEKKKHWQGVQVQGCASQCFFSSSFNPAIIAPIQEKEWHWKLLEGCNTSDVASALRQHASVCPWTSDAVE